MSMLPLKSPAAAAFNTLPYIFEAERQYERGYISLASAAAISTITVEDAIRVQKIMEKIRKAEPTTRPING